MMAQRSYALHAGTGAAGFGEAVKASAAATGGVMTLMRSDTQGGAPWHVHTREDECFYVVSGRIRVWHGTQVSDLDADGFVFLPRNEPHAWDVLSPQARVLLITVPAMLETFLGEFHAATSQEARYAIAARYGVSFLPEDFDPSTWSYPD